MPTRPDDARARRSVEALRGAFIGLLEARPLEQISNKDITQAAGLSYPTFFRRFSNKEELLEHIATEEIRKLLSFGKGTTTRRDPEETIRDMCEYIQAQKRLWRTLLTSDAASAMRKEFAVIAEQIDQRRRRRHWMPKDLGKSFVVSGIFEILAWWMRQPDDYPVENVITLFNVLIIELAETRRDVKLL
jgi:AcrR family transcriptional regulator